MPQARRLAAVAAPALLMCTALGEQSYPLAPLRFFVPMVALQWIEQLGQQALSDKRTGANSTIGTEQVAH